MVEKMKTLLFFIVFLLPIAFSRNIDFRINCDPFDACSVERWNEQISFSAVNETVRQIYAVILITNKTRLENLKAVAEIQFRDIPGNNCNASKVKTALFNGQELLPKVDLMSCSYNYELNFQLDEQHDDTWQPFSFTIIQPSSLQPLDPGPWGFLSPTEYELAYTTRLFPKGRCFSQYVIFPSKFHVLSYDSSKINQHGLYLLPSGEFREAISYDVCSDETRYFSDELLLEDLNASRNENVLRLLVAGAVAGAILGFVLERLWESQKRKRRQNRD